MSIGVLLLAAGSSRRFGGDKRLARLPGGGALLDTTLSNINDAGLPVLVCLRHDDAALAAVLAGRGVDHCLCPRSATGMAGTLADGIDRVPQWEGALIALADMPGIRSETYCAVAANLNEDMIHVPVFAGRRGHPVGFGRHFFTALAALTGDSGARQLLNRFAGQVSEVEVEDSGILDDADLPSDLDKFHIPGINRR